MAKSAKRDPRLALRVKPAFSSFEDFEEWLDDESRHRFSRASAFAGGNWAALHDALIQALEDSSDEETAPAPRWVLEGALTLFYGQSHRLRTTRKAVQRQRASKWHSQWRRDQIDWHRFREVYYRHIARGATDVEHPTRRELRTARRDFERQNKRDQKRTIATWLPYPWQAGNDRDDVDVFEAVSRVFERSKLYRGTPGEIRQSWERVSRALAAGEAWRYYPSKWLQVEGQMRSIDSEHAR